MHADTSTDREPDQDRRSLSTDLGVARLAEALQTCRELISAGLRARPSTGNTVDHADAADAHRHLTRLLSASLDLFVERADPSRPVPTVWMTPTRKFLGDSPDTIYTTVPVSSAHSYRIEVDPGAALYVGLVAYGRDREDGPVHIVASTLDTELTPTVGDGHPARYVVDVAPAGQTRGGAPHNHLEIDASTFWVMVRQYFAAPYPTEPGSVTVTRTDGAAPDSPPVPAQLARGLTRAAEWLEAQVRADLAIDAIMGDPTGRLRTDPATVDHSALISQFFPTPDIAYQGCRTLVDDGEQVRVEVRPPACRFWSVSVMTPWLESLEQLVVPASINSERATPNDDGSFTVVVAEHDPGPGVRNWIPLRGYRQVQLAYRVLLAAEAPDTAEFIVERVAPGDSQS